MAQDHGHLPQYYGQQLQDGTLIESSVVPRHGRGSSDSKQELLRLPIQPHPAHFDHMEPISPVMPMGPNNVVGLTPKPSNIRRVGGHADPDDWNTLGRAYSSPEDATNRHRKPSHDFRTVPYSPATHRCAYVEDYSDEEEVPRAYRYRRRTTRQHRRPPAANENYYNSNSRYGPLPSKGRDSLDAYADTPGKPEYHMHYGSDDEYQPRRPGMPGAGGGRGPPRLPPSAESVMRLPWAIWMGSNAKNRKSLFPYSSSIRNQSC